MTTYRVNLAGTDKRTKMATSLYVGFVFASFLSAVHCYSCDDWTTYCEYGCCYDYGDAYCCDEDVANVLGIVLGVIGGVLGFITILVIIFCCCRKSRGAQGTTFVGGIANPGVGQVVVNTGAPGTYPAYGQQQPMAMGTTQAVGGYNAPPPMGAYPVTQPMGGYNAPQPMGTAPEPRDGEKWQQAPPAYSTLN